MDLNWPSSWLSYPQFRWGMLEWASHLEFVFSFWIDLDRSFWIHWARIQTMECLQLEIQGNVIIARSKSRHISPLDVGPQWLKHTKAIKYLPASNSCSKQFMFDKIVSEQWKMKELFLPHLKMSAFKVRLYLGLKSRLASWYNTKSKHVFLFTFNSNTGKWSNSLSEGIVNLNRELRHLGR